jgi:hypothetical protein
MISYAQNIAFMGICDSFKLIGYKEKLDSIEECSEEKNNFIIKFRDAVSTSNLRMLTHKH